MKSRACLQYQVSVGHIAVTWTNNFFLKREYFIKGQKYKVPHTSIEINAQLVFIMLFAAF